MPDCSQRALADIVWTPDDKESDTGRRRALADLLLDSGDDDVLPESMSSRPSQSLPLRVPDHPSIDLTQTCDDPAPAQPQIARQKRCRDESIVDLDATPSIVAKHGLDADDNWRQHQAHFVRTGFPAKKGVIWHLKNLAG